LTLKRLLECLISSRKSLRSFCNTPFIQSDFWKKNKCRSLKFSKFVLDKLMDMIVYFGRICVFFALSRQNCFCLFCDCPTVEPINLFYKELFKFFPLSFKYFALDSKASFRKAGWHQKREDFSCCIKKLFHGNKMNFESKLTYWFLTSKNKSE